MFLVRVRPCLLLLPQEKTFRNLSDISDISDILKFYRRSGIRTWEDLIQDCYTVLRAMRTPVEAISTVYKIEQRDDKDEVYGESHYKNVLKQACVDISIIIDNFKTPEGW